jgi:hypothetical protein
MKLQTLFSLFFVLLFSFSQGSGVESEQDHVSIEQASIITAQYMVVDLSVEDFAIPSFYSYQYRSKSFDYLSRNHTRIAKEKAKKYCILKNPRKHGKTTIRWFRRDKLEV